MSGTASETPTGRLLQDEVAIIAGGAQGIGRAVAERFIGEGATCIVIDRDTDALTHLASSSEQKVIPIEGDLREPEVHARAVELAQLNYGQLDHLVCVAGIWDFFKRIDRLTPAEIDTAFDEIMHVNVKSALLAVNASVSALRSSSGSITLTGSNASFAAQGGGVLYTASKFAVRGIVTQLAAELAPDIRVNAVAPGGTATALTGPAALGQNEKRLSEDTRMVEAVRSGTPLGICAPEDHTGIYLTLASRKLSPKVTGAIYLSDGGLLVR